MDGHREQGESRAKLLLGERRDAEVMFGGRCEKAATANCPIEMNEVYHVNYVSTKLLTLYSGCGALTRTWNLTNAYAIPIKGVQTFVFRL